MSDKKEHYVVDIFTKKPSLTIDGVIPIKGDLFTLDESFLPYPSNTLRPVSDQALQNLYNLHRDTPLYDGPDPETDEEFLARITLKEKPWR